MIQSFPTYHPGEEKIAKEQEKKEDELDDATDNVFTSVGLGVGSGQSFVHADFPP